MNGLVKAHKKYYNTFQVSDDFFNLFWSQRNESMAIKIGKLVQKNSKPFVAIGASHLGGYDGVLSLLIKRGFSVIPMSM